MAFCRQAGVLCYRGSEEDVLERYYQTSDQRRPDAIVRLTADCPLIDPDVVEKVIDAYRDNFPHCDYVSNSLQRTYPRGLDTEIFSLEALNRTYQEARQADEREHVTLYLYRHPEIFRLLNVASPVLLSHYRWTVDTPEDFKLIRLILEALYPINPCFRLADIVALLERHPDWETINAHIEQKPFNLS